MLGEVSIGSHGLRLTGCACRCAEQASVPGRLGCSGVLSTLRGLLRAGRLSGVSIDRVTRATRVKGKDVCCCFSSGSTVLRTLMRHGCRTPVAATERLTRRERVSPFAHVTLVFRTYQGSSTTFLGARPSAAGTTPRQTFLRRGCVGRLVISLGPILTSVVRRKVTRSLVHYTSPISLTRVMLVMLAIGVSGALMPSATSRVRRAVSTLISLLRGKARGPTKSLGFLVTRLWTIFYSQRLRCAACPAVLGH